ncbi:MAG: hypothetical protein ACYDC3_08335 [Candidatus Binataceae bacterium]
MKATGLLDDWVRDAIQQLGGSVSLVEVAKKIWNDHEGELRKGGNLFYTWQYDMRWAAERLRKQGTLKSASISPRGIWELSR